ncbi:MAG: hypothetical protein IID40_01240 [Planctomycetes bacterium]|nr:hypothetical protein [Planctomycetota bacterium]
MPPKLQALVLADHVYIDAQSGKKIIAGTFNTLRPKEIPSVSGQAAQAFVSVTNIHGALELVLRYVDLEDNRVLCESQPIKVVCDNPLSTVDLVVPLPPLPMPHEGVFAFEVYTGSHLLGSLRVTVAKLEREDQP